MGCRVKGFWREQKLYIAQGFAFDVLYIYSLCVFLLFLSFHFCSLLCLVFVGIISKFRKLRTTKRKQACLVTDVIKKVSLLMSASICSVEFILNVKEQRLLFVLFSWIFTNNFTPWNNTLVCLFVYVCVCACPSGRPLPPTPSSSLLPPAPPPPSAPLHQTATSIRECQMPLLDSGSSHAILDPPPDDEFSPNSYLLRAQPPTTGKSVSLHRRLLHSIHLPIIISEPLASSNNLQSPQMVPSLYSGYMIRY